MYAVAASVNLVSRFERDQVAGGGGAGAGVAPPAHRDLADHP